MAAFGDDFGQLKLIVGEIFTTLGVFKNRGKTPQIIHFNRVLHAINHPFWGTTIFGNTHIVGILTYVYHYCRDFVGYTYLYLPSRIVSRTKKGGKNHLGK